MKYSTGFISMLTALCLPSAVQACNYYPDFTNSVSFADTIMVPDNLPVGGLIARASFTGSVRSGVSICPSPVQQVAIGRFTTLVMLPGPHSVYQTNVEGVGMLVHSTLRGGIKYYHPLQNSSVLLRPESYEHTQTNITAEFYKVGPVLAGTFPSGNLQELSWNGRKISQLLLNTSVRFVTAIATCDLAAGDINRMILLDPVPASTFQSATTAGANNFELTAHCKDASNVTFRFSGTPAPGNDRLFANTGSADGVALWLYSRINGSTQNIFANGTENTRTVVVSGNRAVLPLGAAYHKNGTVGPGTLTSVVTVSITYN
ncbi:fimbrial protein [Pseudomonas fluorescens]|uniref:Fimbrial protein n=1 Tax=Pseudomonas fluorescens TaxID=294 RepID=A0A379I692_PSEFL|nr:fimbrial protein [Pseudomonas fluorescens]AIG04362.1 hypothetical protein HZ99_20050 [Pseudomonas fluorescens]SUD27641.1 fimbrial protein [Pseudomonas fluorescens]